MTDDLVDFLRAVRDTVTCPQCWVPAGRDCITNVAEPSPAVHVRRWDYYDRVNHDVGDEDRS